MLINQVHQYDALLFYGIDLVFCYFSQAEYMLKLSYSLHSKEDSYETQQNDCDDLSRWKGYTIGRFNQ